MLVLKWFQSCPRINSFKIVPNKTSKVSQCDSKLVTNRFQTSPYDLQILPTWFQNCLLTDVNIVPQWIQNCFWHYCKMSYNTRNIVAKWFQVCFKTSARWFQNNPELNLICWHVPCGDPIIYVWLVPHLGFKIEMIPKCLWSDMKITDRILGRFLWNSEWNLEGCCQDSCKNPGRIEQGGFWNYAQYAVRILEFWKDSSDSWRILWSFCKYPASCGDLQKIIRSLQNHRNPSRFSQRHPRVFAESLQNVAWFLQELLESLQIPKHSYRILSGSIQTFLQNHQ